MKKIEIEYIYEFIEDYLDNKIDMLFAHEYGEHEQGADGILFETHFLKCRANDKKDIFTAQIDLGNNEILTSWEGKPFTGSTDEQAIKECLSRVEACSRAHLLPKFLIAKGWQKSETKITLRNKDHKKWEKEHPEYEDENLNLQGATLKENAERFINATKAYFGSRISNIKITDVEDHGYDTEAAMDNQFSFTFRMYDYFDMVGGGGLGIGWSIIKDNYVIDLPSSQYWFIYAVLEEFFKDMEEEIELRIPDEYLAAKSWEKKQPPTDEGKNAQKSENVAYFDLDD